MSYSSYELEIPTDEAMEAKAKALVESFYADPAEWESADQLVTFVNYVRSYCSDFIDIIAEEMFKKQAGG